MNKDGGPAFPVPSNTVQMLPDKTLLAGMSLRDWFAGQALSGDLEQGSRDNMDDQYWHQPSVVAARAYAIADAMLAERAK